MEELSKTSTLEYKKYLGDYPEEQKELKDSKKVNNRFDDEGYYYERQLFTTKGEQKLTKFNFLQALMLIDEDAYNLDPVYFHYCFLKLKDSINYSFIKENFESNLLKKLLKNIDINFEETIKSLTFIGKRSSNIGDEMYFEFERVGYDVMSSYATK